jgi:hypothetical protein
MRAASFQVSSCEVRRPEDAGRVAGSRARERGPTVRQDTREIARGARAFKKSFTGGKTNKTRGIAKCEPRIVYSNMMPSKFK